jgi:hypothetical protein
LPASTPPVVDPVPPLLPLVVLPALVEGPLPVVALPVEDATDPPVVVPPVVPEEEDEVMVVVDAVALSEGLFTPTRVREACGMLQPAPHAAAMNA